MAERSPGKAALVDERGSTSWADLDTRVNRLVHALRHLRLAPGDTVALMCANRREAFEITLAAMHTSLIVVPVNWHWVADELAYVLTDAGASVLFVDDLHLDVAQTAARDIDSCRHRVIIGDPGRACDDFTPYEDLVASGSPDEPDQQGSGGPMFYTSGTTGFPKGVRGTLTQYGLPPTIFQLISGSITGMLGIPDEGVTLLEGPMYHSAQWIFVDGAVGDGLHRGDASPLRSGRAARTDRPVRGHQPPPRTDPVHPTPEVARATPGRVRRIFARGRGPWCGPVSRRGEAPDARVVGTGHLGVLRRHRRRIPRR